MRLCRASALASALLTLAAVAEARAGEPEAEPTATSSAAEDGLVRRERPEEGPGLEVGRLALRFPGALIELAFTPCCRWRWRWTSTTSSIGSSTC